MANIYSEAGVTAEWYDTSAWIGGVVPTSADDAYITGADTTIVLSTASAVASNVTVQTSGTFYQREYLLLSPNNESGNALYTLTCGTYYCYDDLDMGYSNSAASRNNVAMRIGTSSQFLIPSDITNDVTLRLYSGWMQFDGESIFKIGTTADPIPSGYNVTVWQEARNTKANMTLTTDLFTIHGSQLKTHMFWMPSGLSSASNVLYVSSEPSALCAVSGWASGDALYLGCTYDNRTSGDKVIITSAAGDGFTFEISGKGASGYSLEDYPGGYTLDDTTYLNFGTLPSAFNVKWIAGDRRLYGQNYYYTFAVNANNIFIRNFQGEELGYNVYSFNLTNYCNGETEKINTLKVENISLLSDAELNFNNYSSYCGGFSLTITDTDGRNEPIIFKNIAGTAPYGGIVNLSLWSNLSNMSANYDFDRIMTVQGCCKGSTYHSQGGIIYNYTTNPQHALHFKNVWAAGTPYALSFTSLGISISTLLNKDIYEGSFIKNLYSYGCNYGLYISDTIQGQSITLDINDPGFYTVENAYIVNTKYRVVNGTNMTLKNIYARNAATGGSLLYSVGHSYIDNIIDYNSSAQSSQMLIEGVINDTGWPTLTIGNFTVCGTPHENYQFYTQNYINGITVFNSNYDWICTTVANEYSFSNKVRNNLTMNQLALNGLIQQNRVSFPSAFWMEGQGNTSYTLEYDSISAHTSADSGRVFDISTTKSHIIDIFVDPAITSLDMYFAVETTGWTSAAGIPLSILYDIGTAGKEITGTLLTTSGGDFSLTEYDDSDSGWTKVTIPIGSRSNNLVDWHKIRLSIGPDREPYGNLYWCVSGLKYKAGVPWLITRSGPAPAAEGGAPFGSPFASFIRN